MSALESSLRQVIISTEMAIQAEMYLPALILIYAGIDTAAWLACTSPDEGVRSRFCRWVDRWLVPAKQIGCTSLDLYGARCGVLHTFTSDSDLSRAGKARRICYAFGGTTAQQLQDMLERSGRADCVAVHLGDLFEAFRLGLADYLEHALSDPQQSVDLAQKAERYFGLVSSDDSPRQPSA
jgi:hypothetical protein